MDYFAGWRSVYDKEIPLFPMMYWCMMLIGIVCPVERTFAPLLLELTLIIAAFEPVEVYVVGF